MATWWDFKIKNDGEKSFKVENYKCFPVYIKASEGNVTSKHKIHNIVKFKKQTNNNNKKTPHKIETNWTKMQRKPQQLHLLWD